VEEADSRSRDQRKYSGWDEEEVRKKKGAIFQRRTEGERGGGVALKSGKP